MKFSNRVWQVKSLTQALAICLLLALSCPPGPALAQQSLLPGAAESDDRNQTPERNQASPGALSQKEALDQARARFAGAVISINEVRTRNAPMRYRIRMDNDGNIFTIFVDSQTGAVTRE